MKQHLISLIQINCLLPRHAMVFWVNNLTFQKEPSDALRQLIIAEIKSNGQMSQDGWNLLINNVVFEDNASISAAVALTWIAERACPTCNQLKEFINAFKIQNNYALTVQTNVLDLLDLDIVTTSEKEPSESCKHKTYIQGGTLVNQTLFETLIVSRIPRFYLRNYDLIKDAQAYYILERYTPAKRSKYGKSRKGGWKRDKALMNLGGVFHNGWNNQNITITATRGHRPNEIPITNPKQLVDFKPENYIALEVPTSNNYMPRRVGIGKNNPLSIQSGGRTYPVTKIQMRVRVGFKIGDVEKISKPLKYFSIFAQETNPTNLGLDNVSEKAVLISIQKY